MISKRLIYNFIDYVVSDILGNFFGYVREYMLVLISD